MKIGLISDIHGEPEALKRALTLLDGVDTILCAGDLVDKGPNGEGVMRIIQQEEIPTVQGNHDYMARAMQEFRERIGDIPGDDDWLTLPTIVALEALPRTLRFTFEGVSILLSHAAPWPGWDYVWPNSPPAIFQRVIETAPEDIIVMGHTHHPLRVDLGKRTLLNPGSVGGAHSHGSQTCATLTLPQRTFEVISLLDGSPHTYVHHAY